MNHSAEDDDAIERWLAQARADPIADEGFTAKLMRRLPARAQPWWRHARLRAPLAGAAVGAVALTVQLGSTQLWPSLLVGGVAGPITAARSVAMAFLLGMTGLAVLWAWVERDG